MNEEKKVLCEALDDNALDAVAGGARLIKSTGEAVVKSAVPNAELLRPNTVNSMGNAAANAMSSMTSNAPVNSYLGNANEE